MTKKSNKGLKYTLTPQEYLEIKRGINYLQHETKDLFDCSKDQMDSVKILYDLYKSQEDKIERLYGLINEIKTYHVVNEEAIDHIMEYALFKENQEEEDIEIYN